MLCLGFLRHLTCYAVFIKKWIRDHKKPSCAKGFQRIERSLPGNNLGIRFILIHRLTAFLSLFFPNGRKICVRIKKL